MSWLVPCTLPGLFPSHPLPWPEQSPPGDDGALCRPQAGAGVGRWRGRGPAGNPCTRVRSGGLAVTRGAAVVCCGVSPRSCPERSGVPGFPEGRARSHRPEPRLVACRVKHVPPPERSAPAGFAACAERSPGRVRHLLCGQGALALDRPAKARSAVLRSYARSGLFSGAGRGRQGRNKGIRRLAVALVRASRVRAPRPGPRSGFAAGPGRLRARPLLIVRGFFQQGTPSAVSGRCECRRVRCRFAGHGP